MPVRLQSVDLNLLVILDALLSEPTVTAAARRLGLSQSATSHALGRLRELFGDPLLQRSPRGMVPSARARELAGPLRRILQETENVLEPPADFDPKTSRATFSIGMDDATQAGFLPPLIERIRKEAPGVRIRADGSDLGLPLDALARGQLDVAIKVRGRLPEGFRSEPVTTARHVTIARRGHPRLRSRPSLKRFAELDHVVNVSPLVDAEIDRYLAEHSLRRRHAVIATSFLSIPWVVARSDLVATIPDHFYEVARQALPLVAHVPPIPLRGFQVVMIWHDRAHHDPGQVWLRGVVRELVRPVRGGRAG